MKIGNIIVKLWVDYRLPLILFTFCFNYYVYTIGFMNLIVQKTCFPGGPPGTNVVCNKTAAFQEFNTMSTVRLTVHEVSAGLVVLVAGPWRDQTGLTLPLIVVAHVGEFIASGMTLFSSFVWEFSPWATVLVDSFSGLFGSRMLITVALVSHISERTTVEERPARLAVVVVAMLGGMCLSFAAGGFFLSFLNYSWFMAMVFVIYFLNVALSFHSIQDGKRKNPGKTISLKTILRSIGMVFKRRKNFFVSWVVMYSNFAMFGLMNAESAVTHAFFQKVLVMNPEDSGLLQSFRLLVSLLMSLLATPLLMGIFKISAFTVAIISTIPSAISCFCMAFVSSVTQAYIFYGLDMMRVFLGSILWTLLTACIKKSEIGVYSSFHAFGDAITPLFINPLYLYIFNSTIDTLPGAFFIVSGCIMVSSTFLLWVASFFYEKIEDDEEVVPPELETDKYQKKKTDCCS